MTREINFNWYVGDIPEIENLSDDEFLMFIKLGIFIKTNIIDNPNFSDIKKIKPEYLENYLFELINIGYKSKHLIIEDVDKDKLISILSHRIISNIPTSSHKKGEQGENNLKYTISNNFPHIRYIDTHNDDHCGDAHLLFPNGKKVILESKNYKTTINNIQVDKLKNDMIYTDIDMAILISHNSNIVGINNDRIFDTISFINNNRPFLILCIPNYNNEISKLECIFILINQIIKHNYNNFGYNNLKAVLDEILFIIQQNKDVFDKEEDKINKIKKSLDEIVDNRRKFIDTLERIIIDKMNDYSKKEKKFNNFIEIFINSKYYNDIKIFCDLLIQYNCYLVEDLTKWIIQSNDLNIIGYITINRKKPIIIFDKNQYYINNIKDIEEEIKNKINN